MIKYKTRFHGQSRRASTPPYRETGTIRKKWHGRISIAVVFPDLYPLGMSNLGHQTVYRLLNLDDRLVAERIFMPARNHNVRMGGRFRQDQRSRWISVESSRRLRDFDVILFSISFESNYLNLVRALRDEGLTLRSSARGNNEPLIFAGGIATQINPEPISPFVDAFLLGDFEVLGPYLVDSLPAFFKNSVEINRQDLLRELAHTCPGVYVPQAYQPVFDRYGRLDGWNVSNGFPERILPARITDSVDVAPFSQVISPDAAFSNMFLVELSRGCGKGCRFCAAGYVNRPPRPWGMDAIDAALRGLKDTDKVGLIGLEFLESPMIEQLCRRLLHERLHLAFSSLRADALSDDFILLLKKSGQKTATIAPEAGSERLRCAINKNLGHEAIVSAAERLVASGIPNLKLYFMIGLPTENLDDINGILELVKEIDALVRPIGKSRGHLGRITVSVSSFVPKAWTPFQWAAFAGIPALIASQRVLKKGLAKIPNVQLRLDAPKRAMFQAVLSRGDRRLASLLEIMADQDMPFSVALKKTLLCSDTYLGSREEDTVFPWDLIRHRVKKDYLWREWKRTLNERPTAFCQPGNCKKCGACIS